MRSYEAKFVVVMLRHIASSAVVTVEPAGNAIVVYVSIVGPHTRIRGAVV
jgi:hypothetical protein